MFTDDVLKYGSLAILVLQNTSLVLQLKHSLRASAEEKYIPTTVVICMEVVKLIACSMIHLASHLQSKTDGMQLGLKSAILAASDEIGDGMLQMLIPAAVYAFQNNLLFVALSNLDSTIFQVTYQLKTVVTALFMAGMLGRKLSHKDWLALALLMLGVVMVQIQTMQTRTFEKSPPEDPIADAPLDQEEMELLQHVPIQSAPAIEVLGMGQNYLLGIAAVLAACLSSGFAGTYFEKVVKRSSKSLWARNVQLAIFGTFFSILACVHNDASRIVQEGYFTGYTIGTVFIVINQALGGIIVAVVVKYADNLLKAFSTGKNSLLRRSSHRWSDNTFIAMSIILGSILSIYIFDFHISFSFLIGTAIVLYAAFSYGRPERSTMVADARSRCRAV